MNDHLTGMSAEELRLLAEKVAEREQLTQRLIELNSEIARMMSGDAPVRVPRDRNRGEKIVEAIKAAGKDGIGYAKLSAAVGACEATICTWLNQHAKEWPALEKLKDGTSVRWCWNAESRPSAGAVAGGK
jgi:hypothetical protein